MTTATANTLPNVSDLRRLSSPTEQLKRAADTITKAEQKMNRHALRRNAAAVLLFQRGQQQTPPMQPAAMWRDTIVVSRSLWVKITDEADEGRLQELDQEMTELLADIDLALREEQPVTYLARQRDKVGHKLARRRAQVQAIEDLMAEVDEGPVAEVDLPAHLDAMARREAGVVRACEVLIEQMKKFRDELAIKLMAGAFGTPVANAEIARITGLSTARVAQLRQLR